MPSATALATSRFDAAISRTSTLTSRVSPTRRISRSWIARRSLTCTEDGTSVISSRKRVPPAAAEKSPIVSATAPVKAPFTWPKSSDSMSVSGIAPQLTDTNGPLRRGLSSWNARATSSLPVPLSPVTRTVESLSAALRIVLLCGAKHRGAPHLPHPEVGDDEVEGVALEGANRGLAPVRDRHVVTRLLQHDREELTHAALVVDDQNARVRHGGPAASP